MGLELILPFFASIAVTLLLRKLDRSNYRLSQIKRYTTKLTDDINQVAMSGVQAVKDANIDLDILNKQAKKLISDMNSKFSETKVLVESIKANKEYLDSLTGDLTNVVKLTSEIRKESEYVQEGLHLLQMHRHEISNVETEIDSVRSEMAKMAQKFQIDVNDRSNNILESLAIKIVEIESLLETKADSVDQTVKLIADSYKDKLRENVDSLIQETVGRVEKANEKMDGFFSQIRESERNIDSKVIKFKDTADAMTEKVQKLDLQFDERVSTISTNLEEQLELFERKYHDKFDIIMSQVNQSKEIFMRGLNKEVDIIREEVQNLNLETLTRRDDILNETRRQAETINESISIFQEKYLDAENKLLKQAESKKNEMIRDMDKLEDEFRRISDTLQAETEEAKESVVKSLQLFETDLDKSYIGAENVAKERLKALKIELEESLINFYSTEKVEINKSINRIEEKVELLGKATVEKMRSIDDYFSDLKNALNESAKEIISQVEVNVSRVSKNLDEEKLRVDEKLNDFYTLKNKLEENLANLHNKKKDEFIVELSKIESKIGDLNSSVNSKIKTVDEHFVDLKKALLETASDIISQVETDVSKLASQLDEEKLKVDEKLETVSTGWLSQLDKIKNRSSKDIDDLVTRLKDIHIEGQELSNTFKSEYGTFKNQLESQLRKNIDIINAEAEAIADDMHHKVKKSKEEADEILTRVQRSGILMYEKQEALMSDHSERLSKELQVKLEKVREESQELLDDVQKSGMNLIEKQEEKFHKFTQYIDEKLYKELQTKFERSKYEAEEILSKLSVAGNEIIQKQSDKLNQFSLTLDERLFKDLQTKLEKLRNESKEMLQTIEQTNTQLVARHQDNVSKLNDEIEVKLFKELKDKFEDVKSDSEYILDEVQRIQSNFRHSYQEEMTNFKSVVDEKLYKELLFKFEKLKGDAEQTLENMTKNGISIFERHEEKLSRVSEVIDERFHRDIKNKLDSAKDEGVTLLEGLKRAGEQIISEQQEKFNKFNIFVDDKLLNETQAKLERMKKETEALLADVKETGEQVIEKQQEKMNKFNSTLDERISRQLAVLLDKGQIQLDQLEIRIGSYIQDIKNNLEHTLSTAKEDSDRQLENFNNQMHKNFREIEKLNINFMETHKAEFERTRTDFEKTKEDFTKIKTVLDHDLDRIKNIKQDLFRDLNTESNRLKRVVDSIAEKVHNLEGYTDIIDNTERVMQESDRKIEDMITLIEKMKSEKETVAIYLKNVEFIKSSKQAMEDEIRQLDNQKNRIEQLERELSRASEVCSLINQRTEDIKDKIIILNTLDGKLQYIHEVQSKLEGKISDVEVANKKITELTQLVSVHDKNSEKMIYRLDTLLKEVQLIEAKEMELSETIEHIDKKTADLQARNIDIKSIESKFSKIENLMEDLSNKHKQISNLQRRIQDLRNETENMKTGLEKLLEEADHRFSKLGNFLEVVDSVVTETSASFINKSAKSKQSINTSKENADLMKRKRATVMNLYENFDWNSETIAEKLNLEQSLVEAIINSSTKTASYSRD